MGREERAKTREIEGVTYTVTPVTFSIGRPAIMRLLKIVTPVVGAFYREGTQQEGIAAILETLPGVLCDADVIYFAETFGPHSTYADGDKQVPLVPKNQEQHFDGKFLEYFRWLIFCIEVNCAGFFGGGTSGGALSALIGMTKKPSTPTSGSTSSSGSSPTNP